ncbi:sugar nucleotide-binding protein [Bradyrhizobium canariense]|uniref:RmlD-like substrate binding domain-containing protein n=1 Tax=Bradyrhizobium canariense TaxID=255045 RepID=A0A1X3FRV4_9BRAD|nr:hypothetical protein BSZ22_17950 [Bradyrhizobium canariense]OSI78268.1 hypothetical protein BSZ23_18925 [Bradyrhizobium canariense]OSI90230.1 hypothetical protein BSZ25_18575 [Bradyrhizobium canariense]OSI93579.1 hypothetical protein BSZ24_12860 [Bradyrhizobium canariense]OSJ03556.1 hypothetical protein BSZ16_15835 [Bradyrhizobium canariense]
MRRKAIGQNCFTATSSPSNNTSSSARQSPTHAILESLRFRGVSLKATEVIPIASSEYHSKVTRPTNSRLDLTCLREAYGIQPPSWERPLAEELDALGPLHFAR